MKCRWWSLVALMSLLNPCLSQQELRRQEATSQQWYVQVPEGLIIDSSISQFTQQISDNQDANLLAYLQDLGLVVDKQVSRISLMKLDYLTKQDHQLVSLDLDFKIVCVEHSVSYQHVILPVSMFDYLVKIPTQIESSYEQFSQTLVAQTPESLLRFLQDNHFEIDSKLKVRQFRFDQTARILTIDFIDQVTPETHYQGTMNLNLNPISFVKPNSQVINNSGVYLSIGLSVAIFVSLGIYITSFVLKVKRYKQSNKTKKDDQDGVTESNTSETPKDNDSQDDQVEPVDASQSSGLTPSTKSMKKSSSKSKSKTARDK